MIVPLLQERGEGGVRGLAACVAGSRCVDGDDNRNGDFLSRKRVEQGKRREGIERWVCFFILSYFVIVFLLIFFNAGQLISAIVTACCCYHHGEKKVSQ